MSSSFFHKENENIWWKPTRRQSTTPVSNVASGPFDLHYPPNFNLRQRSDTPPRKQGMRLFFVMSQVSEFNVGQGYRKYMRVSSKIPSLS